jgi:hypothetical protein
MFQQLHVRALLFRIGAPTCPMFLGFLFFCQWLHSLLNDRHIAGFVRHHLVVITVLATKVATANERTCTVRLMIPAPLGALLSDLAEASSKSKGISSQALPMSTQSRQYSCCHSNPYLYVARTLSSWPLYFPGFRSRLQTVIEIKSTSFCPWSRSRPSLVPSVAARPARANCRPRHR